MFNKNANANANEKSLLPSLRTLVVDHLDVHHVWVSRGVLGALDERVGWARV
jgi:hypothetical protein